MSSDLNHLLAKWHEAKQELTQQEEKVEKYKAKVVKLMKDTNRLSSSDFTVDKRSITRESVSKASIPAEIWKQYASKATFDAYYLKKIIHLPRKINE
jgi:hypothetical protein